jgi:hypothetical protein
MQTQLVRAYCCLYVMLGLNGLLDFPFHQVTASLAYFAMAALVYIIYAGGHSTAKED